MKNLLEFLLIHFVSYPEEVVVEEVPDELGMEYRLTVHPDDVAQVIGRRGRVIKAIRKLAQIRAVKDGIRVKVSIVE